MPGNIVSVNDLGGGYGSMKQGCHGRLSASAATIHSQNPRSAIVGSVRIEKQTEKVTDWDCLTVNMVSTHRPGIRYPLAWRPAIESVLEGWQFFALYEHAR